MSEKKEKPPKIPYLCVSSNGETTWIELDDASNALIGSGSHCKVQISGREIRSLHCIVAMKEGSLEVRDWNTGCTFVNGEAISEPTELKEGDCLKIGDFEITAVLSEAGAMAAAKAEESPEVSQEPTVEDAVTVEPVQEEIAEQPPVVEPVAPAEEPVVESVAEPFVAETTIEPVLEENPAAEMEQTLETDDIVAPEPVLASEPEVIEQNDAEPTTETDNVNAVEAEPASAEEETPQVESVIEQDADPQPESTPAGFVYDIDADFGEEEDDQSFGFAAPQFADDLVGSEELQTLRMENEQLRFELSELANRNAGSAANSEVLSREQTVKLVSRLEDMVKELKRSDARSLEMEELLRSADQATYDEQEERKQMEKWVSELESRVTQRESESDGEIQTLKKLLEEARQSQQKSNDSLKSVMDSKASEGEAIPAELVDGLRKQIESLQAQLTSSQEEAAALREQLEDRPGASIADDLRKSEQKLAEMQLEASRERAEVSRQRVELQRLKAELEDRLSEPREANAADTRIRAMREHLKELHDKEEEAKANQPELDASAGGGLANRIASLLQRVAGE